MSNVSPVDVAWTALCLWGVWHHTRMWWAIRGDIEALEGGLLPVTPAALSLFRNDAESEFDWAGLKSVLAFIGVVAMFRPSAPLDPLGVIILVLLFGGMLWTRLRSINRGRRRARIIAGADVVTR